MRFLLVYHQSGLSNIGIDLAPGSALPNKAVYRMNPMQQAELQTHVNELIAQGLIHESMSPCAIPALLVPKKDET